MDLVQRSIEVILDGQASSGAYVACPNFPTYHYSWFRDGAFIAYAMDCVGEGRSAARFHDWAAACILNRRDVVHRAIAHGRLGRSLSGEDILHTRYTLDGQDGVKEEWPNFQLDGFGSWLWALRKHKELSKVPLPASWVEASGLVADYLAALWRLPCYDCWEEFSGLVHPHTLAAIYGGVQAQAEISGRDQGGVLDEIKSYVLGHAVLDGRFVKSVGRTDVDASLLGLSTPYRLVSPDDPLMQNTVAAIEEKLRCGGGVHRYAEDTYYGGGEWVQLAAWLGWYYAETGHLEKAGDLLSWVESQQDPSGFLPEQVPENLNDPSYYAPWRQRWGDIATPLLWSHANYLILKSALQG